MPALKLKKTGLRKSASFPTLQMLRMQEEVAPGVPITAANGRHLARPPSQHMLSPFSPVFDMEIDSGKPNPSGFGFDRCRSELDFGQADAQAADAGGSALQQILHICRSSSTFVSQLWQQLHQLRQMHSTASGVDIDAIARELLAAGYLVQLRGEARPERLKDARACLQNLRHRFIVCIGARQPQPLNPGGQGPPGLFADEAVYLAEPLIVEPRMREQFAIAHPTPEYDATFQAVPPCFVGSVAKLEAVVQLLCTEMSTAFKAQGLPFPPWRSRQALLSKWAPEEVAQLALKIAEMGNAALLPAAPPGHAPPATEAAPGGSHGRAAPPHEPPGPPPAAQRGSPQGSCSPPALDAAGLVAMQPAALDPMGGSPSSASCASSGGDAPSSLPVVPAAGPLKFTRKASAEWKPRSSGKQPRGLLTAALKKGGGRVEAACRSEERRSAAIRTSGDEPWSRITTVRWGGAGAAASGGAAGPLAVPLGHRAR